MYKKQKKEVCRECEHEFIPIQSKIFCDKCCDRIAREEITMFKEIERR